MVNKDFKELWKDPRWQKKRLEIMERDEWKCAACKVSKETLVVHHIRYNKSAEGPWDYDGCWLITLCESCHSSCHETPLYLPSVYHDLIEWKSLTPSYISDLWFKDVLGFTK